MPNTMTLINSVTVGAGGAASIDFTSIPSTYTDLCVKVSTRSSANSTYTNPMFVRLNSSTSSYSTRALTNGGANVATSSTNPYGLTSAFYGGEQTTTALTSSTFTNTEIYIPNYAGSANKSISVDVAAENNASTEYTWGLGLIAALWSNTSAITSVSLFVGSSLSGTFQQYSTAYLYGVKNA